MFSKPMMGLMLLSIVQAADSTFAADTDANAAGAGCARCILRKDYMKFTTLTDQRKSFVNLAAYSSGITCASSTSATTNELFWNPAATSPEPLIGACPYDQEICKVNVGIKNLAQTTNLITLNKVGDIATLVVDGGLDGTKFSKLTSSCQWLVKSVCGAPGITFDVATTNFVDADFDLAVMEYSKEFTTSASSSIGLEDEWFPKKTKMPQYWDNTDSAYVSGEPGSITLPVPGTSTYNRVIPGADLKGWIKFLDDEYSAYLTDKGLYEAKVVAYTADKKKDRPNYKPSTPAAYSGPVVTKTMFTQGFGKPTSQLVTLAMKGKSFGVRGGNILQDADYKTDQHGIRFRRELSTSCDDSYFGIVVVPVATFTGTSSKNKLTIKVVNYAWDGNLVAQATPAAASTVPTAVAATTGAQHLKIATASAATLAVLTLF